MTLRWGILGAGAISNDFAAALKAINAPLTAIGASKLDKAKDFADIFDIPYAYGSYEEFFSSPHVDVIYIGTIHPQHYKNTIDALNHGKHVVVEKPFAMNAKQAREMIELARAKKLFLLEGMWTRFFPAVRQAKEMMESGEIGDIVAFQGNHGFFADSSNKRIFDQKLGGGALLDIGVYTIVAAMLAFGPERPVKVGAVAKLSSSGVDVSDALALQFKKGGVANVNFTVEAEVDEESMYIGTKGTILFTNPAHCPVRLTLSKPTDKRGVRECKTFDHPLPPSGAKPGSKIKLNFPHSEGFAYEATRVQECILKGMLECPEYSLNETLALMETLDEIRGQIGVHYDTD